MERTVLECLFIQEMEPVVQEVIPYFNEASELKFYEIVLIVRFGEKTFEIVIHTLDESPAPVA